MPGKVYLVGAGPGDPGLLTERALTVLKRADVVFHDRLIPRSLLDFCPVGSSHLVDIGRLKGEPGTGQAEINRRLVEAAKDNEVTVRLKGGDPLIFGRGFEELEQLEASGVDCRIIPGISSLQAAGSHARLPLTHRQLSSNFAVITAHTSRPEFEHDWSALARLETLCVYMGVTLCQEVAEKLIAAGKPAETPAAVTAGLTTASQKTHRTNLGQLIEQPPEPEKFRPGLIIIGPTAKLAEAQSWFQKLPLTGRRILVTRPSKQSRQLGRRLVERGAEPVQVPLIETAPLEPGLNDLNGEINQLEKYDWLLFTSRNGVKNFFQRLEKLGLDSRALAGLKLACVGPATARALAAEGLQADLVPEKFTTRRLGRAVGRTAAPGASLLAPRAAGAGPGLAEGLSSYEVELNQVEVYETHPVKPSRARLEALQADRLDALTFTSPSTVDAFFELTPAGKAEELLAEVPAVVIGPVTAEALEQHDTAPERVAERHDAEGLLAALDDFLER